jgi:hypothetical protein
MITSANVQAARMDLIVNNVWSLVGIVAPTAATGAGMAGPGSMYTDTVGKKVYINTGTLVTPAWQVINVT